MAAEPAAEPELVSAAALERALVRRAFAGFQALRAGRLGRPGLEEELSLLSPWADRTRLAAFAGVWVGRSLRGDVPSGPSPRLLQTGRNRVWVCFARDGIELSPAVVAHRAATIEAFGGGAGVLVVGWPSQIEAKACVEAAACQWPPQLLP
jgi:hypothetical protein